MAIISNKGPNSEDRVNLRKMRMEKGAVEDLDQEQRKKTKKLNESSRRLVQIRPNKENAFFNK